jgi:hypothetical protein
MTCLGQICGGVVRTDQAKPAVFDHSCFERWPSATPQNLW